MPAEFLSPLQEVFKSIGSCLTPEVARRLVTIRLDPRVDAITSDLAEKANEGQLSPDERESYEAYIEALDFMALLQLKARDVLGAGEAA